MGTGNYTHPDGHTVILYPDESLDEDAFEDPDDFASDLDFVLEQIETLILDCLSPTWSIPGPRARWRPSERNARVIAQNRMFQIWTVSDSYNHLFVTHGLRDDIDDALLPLARAHLESAAMAFFDRFQDSIAEHGLTAHVATSPWTSAPRRIPAAA